MAIDEEGCIWTAHWYGRCVIRTSPEGKELQRIAVPEGQVAAVEFTPEGLFITSSTTALGYSVLTFQPFAEGSAWLDVWDFIVNYNLLPLGSVVVVIFCCSKRWGWGWDKFLAEANTGKGPKVKNWMKPIFCWLVPVAVIAIYIIGLINFPWK